MYVPHSRKELGPGKSRYNANQRGCLCNEVVWGHRDATAHFDSGFALFKIECVKITEISGCLW